MNVCFVDPVRMTASSRFAVLTRKCRWTREAQCAPVLLWKNVRAGTLQHFAGSKNRPAVSHCHDRSFPFSYSHFWERRPRPRAASVIENIVSNGHNLKIVRERRCGEVRIRCHWRCFISWIFIYIVQLDNRTKYSDWKYIFRMT